MTSAPSARCLPGGVSVLGKAAAGDWCFSVRGFLAPERDGAVSWGSCARSIRSFWHSPAWRPGPTEDRMSLVLALPGCLVLDASVGPDGARDVPHERWRCARRMPPLDIRDHPRSNCAHRERWPIMRGWPPARLLRSGRHFSTTWWQLMRRTTWPSFGPTCARAFRSLPRCPRLSTGSLSCLAGAVT